MPTSTNTTRAIGGRVIAVTGGARGIGLETIRLLASRGAKVGAGDLDLDVLEQSLSEVPNSAAFELDVADRDSFERFIDGVEAEFGPIDVLINNAGVMSLSDFVEEDDAVVDKMIDINLFGTMNGMKIAIPRMLKAGRGQIVNIASTGGRIGVPGAAMYSASKFAVYGMTESVAGEYKDSPIAFSVICPVVVNTDLTKGVLGSTRGVPTLEPQDVARAVVNTIEKPRFQVFVPGSTWFSYVISQIMPFRIRQLIERFVRSDRVLRDVDHQARKEYDERMLR